MRAWEHFSKNPKEGQDLSDTVQSAGSTVVYLRRRRDPGNQSMGLESMHYYIPTTHLRSIFEEHRKDMDNKVTLPMYFTLSSHSITRTAAGWVHEKQMHQLLGTSEKKVRIFRASEERHMQASRTILSGTEDSLKEVDVNDSFYWIPGRANFPGVDSVLGDTEGNVYILQATIAARHGSPREGIQRVWRSFKLEVRVNRVWHFVVFAETDQTARQHVLRFSNSLGNLKLGLARVPVHVWGCSRVSL